MQEEIVDETDEYVDVHKRYGVADNIITSPVTICFSES